MLPWRENAATTLPRGLWPRRCRSNGVSARSVAAFAAFTHNYGFDLVGFEAFLCRDTQSKDLGFGACEQIPLQTPPDPMLFPDDAARRNIKTGNQHHIFASSKQAWP